MFLKIIKSVSILFLLVFIIPSFTLSNASQSYTEELSLFATNDSTLWSIKLSGASISLSDLPEAESSFKGVTSYKLFSSSAINWSSEYFIYGPEGYNQFPIYPLPTEGLILTVDSENKAQADVVADRFNSLLKTAFVPYGSDNTNFRYYSSLDFRSVISDVFWNIIPNSNEGLAKLLERQIFLNDLLPMVTLEGSLSETGFERSLTFAGIHPVSLQPPNYNLNLLFPGFKSLNSSTILDNTSINVIFAGGMIPFNNTYSGNVTFHNFPKNVSSSLTFTKNNIDQIVNGSLPVTSGPPIIVATRKVDIGSIGVNSNRNTVEVIIELTNISPIGTPPAENIVLNENWWSERFRLISGNTHQNMPKLDSGESTELVYVLEVIDPEPLDYRPADNQNQINYSYKVANHKINMNTTINDLTLVLNKLRPAIIATVQKANSSNLILGVPINVELHNVGTRTANNITITLNNKLIGNKQTLQPNNKWNFTTIINPDNLISPFKSVQPVVTWEDEDLVTKKANFNSILIEFKRSTIMAPHIKIIKYSQFSTINTESIIKTTSFISIQSVNRTQLFLEEEPPSGTTFISGNLTQSGSILISTKYIESGIQNIAYEYISKAENQYDNYIILPTTLTIRWNGFNLTTASNSFDLPNGLRISQILTKNSGFINSTATVSISITNEGTLPVFNVEVMPLNQAYLEIIQGNVPVNASKLEQGEAINLTFIVKFADSGSFKYSSVRANYIYSAKNNVLTSTSEPLLISPPIELELLPPLTEPIEGEPITILMKIINLSPLKVTNVQAKIPPLLQSKILKGSTDIHLSELPANYTKTYELIVQPTTGLTLKLSKPQVNFEFQDETLNGTTDELIIQLKEDVLLRYTYPTIFALLAIIITAIIIRSNKLETPKFNENKDA